MRRGCAHSRTGADRRPFGGWTAGVGGFACGRSSGATSPPGPAAACSFWARPCAAPSLPHACSWARSALSPSWPCSTSSTTRGAARDSQLPSRVSWSCCRPTPRSTFWHPRPGIGCDGQNPGAGPCPGRCPGRGARDARPARRLHTRPASTCSMSPVLLRRRRSAWDCGEASVASSLRRVAMAGCPGTRSPAELERLVVVPSTAGLPPAPTPSQATPSFSRMAPPPAVAHAAGKGTRRRCTLPASRPDKPLSTRTRRS